jgi:cytidylate kinase
MALITISRGTFGGGKDLAESVAKRLGYRCLSREELLIIVASQFGLTEDELAAARESKPGFLERMSLRRIQYTAYIRAALCREVRNDNVVYHGQGGNLLIGEVPHVLRVRVIADMEFRIKAAMDRHAVSRGKAIKLIKKADEDRAKWSKSVYNVDWQEPSLYDMVVNLARISPDTACELMVVAVQTNFRTTPESQKIMNDLALSADIRARIAAHKGIEDVEVEIAADGGTITVGGKANLAAETDRIMRLVRETPGVSEVKSNMHTRTSGRHESMGEF